MFHVRSEDLAAVRELHESGLTLRAYEQSRSWGPLQEWKGTEARVLAGRMAVQLGNMRLGRTLHLRAYREDSASPESRYYVAYHFLVRRGWLETWRFVEQTPELPGASDEIKSSWLCIRARIASLMRDFDEADRLLDQAQQVAPQSAWVWAERSGVLESEDRYDEALEAAQQSLRMRPWYRPAVQQVAHLLTLQERDAEAIDLLREALTHTEASALAAQLSAYLHELNEFEEARRWIERFAELTPIRDNDTAKWLAARRGDLAYELGDYQECLRWSKLSETKFHEKVVARLEKYVTPRSSDGDTELPLADASPNGGKRVLLPVGFVRQHQLTCAPATLATLSRFWGRSAEHLAIAELICYDGTPRHRGREWAEENGYALREFRVTWDSAVALLDRGIPFALTTVEPTNAHMQAVIGYDGRRGTLLIRDPFIRLLGEALGEEMLNRQRPFGARGMALVPKDRPELVKVLMELDLPDAELNERNHWLETALKSHRRDEAQDEFERMQALAPDDPLTILARRELARYDSDTTTALDCDNRMLAQFEDQPTFVLSKLSLLRDLARRDERIELCRRMCDKKDVHPVFWQQYAQLLCEDARQHDTAQFWLKRALQVNPSDAGNYYILANIRWSQRRFEEAFDLYRFASCLDERNEMLADSYFRAARFLRRTEEALESLKRRFQRFGKKSSLPAQTLFWAYSALERMDEAFDVLREALRLRPDDVGLKLFVAEAALQGGRTEWAAELLAQTEGNAPCITWLQASARLAEFQGDLSAALERWKQIADTDPLSLPTQVRVAELLAELENPAAALEYFRALTARFPYHLAFHQELVARMRGETHDGIETIARHLVEVHPFDAWSHRELALCFSDRRDFASAFAQLDIADQCDPNGPTNAVVRGNVLDEAGRRPEARECFRKAIRLSIDQDYAIDRLLSLCDSTAQRREELQFVWQEMIRQVIFGDGLLAFAGQARGTFEPEELLSLLREALAARPDLWHAWSAAVMQLTEMDRLDEALELAKQATERFPLLPKLWLDLAEIYQHRHDAQSEQDSLRRALEINPNWALAARRLADAYERQHELEEARQVLEGMARRSPMNGGVQIELADLAWKQGEKEDALARLESLLRVQPGFDAAWARLHDWTDELKQPERFETLVREIADKRPTESRSWLIVARHLAKPEHLAERLAALDRVVEMHPTMSEAYDLRAELLVSAHRYEEALAACRPAAWPDRPPIELRGRAAWVEWHRGHGDEAIRQMRDVLTEYTDYHWGWRNLADWAVERQDWALARKAAERLLALTPHYHVAWGYLGESKERADDINGAIEAYETALSLCPDYAFAGLRLFDLRVGKKHFHEAERVLELLRLHVGGPGLEAKAIQLAFAKDEKEAAETALKTLAHDRNAPDWVFEPAMLALRDTRGLKSAVRFVEELLSDPEIHPTLAEWWVHWQFQIGKEPNAKRMSELLERGEAGYRAARQFVEMLARGFVPSGLKKFVKRHGSALARDTVTWGSVGWALTCVEDFRAAADWMSDWRSRSDLKPWMLTNLAQALRAIGKKMESAEASRVGTSLPLDHASRFHELALACDACLQGEFTAARELLGPMDPHGMHSDDRFSLELVMAVLAREMPEPDASPISVDEERRRLTDAARRFKLLGRTTPYRATHRDFVRLVARRASDGTTTWWARWELLRSYLAEIADRLTWPSYAKRRAGAS